uniref:Reverse transcriptase domain-containing protein n=2 Tax=Aegilops tauschii subsp. strangulata TaxID=200361 RepID=A0A453EVJ7_AEGTS
RFENFWTKMPGFQRVVSEAWNMNSGHVEPYQRLFHKLKRTGQKLRSWSKTLFSNSRVQLHMALKVILHLDLAQEQRGLSPEERDLWARLKRRIVGLAVLEKSRKRQNSRITNLKEGDANTRYFHLRVNHRRRKKNLIHRLKHNQGWVTSHEDKEKIVHSHFKNIAKKGPSRSIDVNWGLIPTPNCDLQGLDEAFTEDEVKAAVLELSGDKAPGPDGFTGTFFKACWNTIKPDIMRWSIISPTYRPLTFIG